jgi:hypothetical protein
LAKNVIKLLDRLEGVTGGGRQWATQCSAHADCNPSLSVGISDDNSRILIHCHVDCKIDDVLAAVGMELRDLFSGSGPSNDGPRPPASESAGVATTTVPDANGATNQSDGKSAVSTDHWSKRAQKYERALTKERLQELATTLAVPPEDLQRLSVGWRQRDGEQGLYTFPERDGRGVVIGITTRQLSGEKRAIEGSKRGLTLVIDWATQLREASQIFIVEGPSDVAAACAIGIFAIGRPSARGGVEFLAELLKAARAEQEIIVLGENDSKPDGTWPGRDGAEAVAQKLAAQLRRNIGWVLPAGGVKDLRAWLQGQRRGVDQT